MPEPNGYKTSLFDRHKAWISIDPAYPDKVVVFFEDKIVSYEPTMDMAVAHIWALLRWRESEL